MAEPVEPTEEKKTPAQSALEFFDWFTEAVKTNPPKSEDVYPRNRYSGD
jgi:hypothetical protein